MVRVYPPLPQFLTQDQAERLTHDGLFGDTPDSLRRAVANIQQMWATTTEHVRRLDAALLEVRVDDEWSFVETQRHLVFVTDVWISDIVRGDPTAYHPWGLPPDFAVGGASELGIDLTSAPTLDEVLPIRATRQSLVTEVADQLTDDELRRVCPSRGGQFQVVGAIQTVLHEEWAHHVFATRDLAKLEG